MWQTWLLSRSLHLSFPDLLAHFAEHVFVPQHRQTRSAMTSQSPCVDRQCVWMRP